MTNEPPASGLSPLRVIRVLIETFNFDNRNGHDMNNPFHSNHPQILHRAEHSQSPLIHGFRIFAAPHDPVGIDRIADTIEQVAQ
jgi:hypothetical protein